MPLENQISANITGSISGGISSNVSGQIGGVSANVSARLIPSARDKVPLRLNAYTETTGFRQGGYFYVDDGTNSLRMSVEAVKDLNTKILSVDNMGEVDFDKIKQGDYIYSEN